MYVERQLMLRNVRPRLHLKMRHDVTFSQIVWKANNSLEWYRRFAMSVWARADLIVYVQDGSGWLHSQTTYVYLYVSYLWELKTDGPLPVTGREGAPKTGCGGVALVVVLARRIECRLLNLYLKMKFSCLVLSIFSQAVKRRARREKWKRKVSKRDRESLIIETKIYKQCMSND